MKGIEKSSVSPDKRVIQFNVGQDGVCARLGRMEKDPDGAIEWIEEEPTTCAEWTRKDEDACRDPVNNVRPASCFTTIMPRPETVTEPPSSIGSPSSSAFTVPSSMVQDTAYTLTAHTLRGWTPDPTVGIAMDAKKSWDRQFYL